MAFLITTASSGGFLAGYMLEMMLYAISFFCILFVCLFLAVLGFSLLHADLSLVAASEGSSLVTVCRLLFAVASLVAEHEL